MNGFERPCQPWLRRSCRPTLLALSLAGALGIGGVLALRGASQGEPPGVPSRSEGGRVAAIGLVEGASREIALFPEVAGTLAVVHVRVGEEVKAGTLLFELHHETQSAQLAVAEAEFTSANVQAQQAVAEWHRSRRLIGSQAISQQNYDTDQFRHLVAQAKAAEAEARLRLARAEMARTQVKAPQPGRVLQIHHEPGTLIEPRQLVDPVVRLADVSRRRVRAWVEELDVARVAAGQRAVVTADGFHGQAFAGRVVEIAGRMGKDAPRSNRSGEREDIYYREVVVELDGGRELPLNLRVEVVLNPRQ